MHKQSMMKEVQKQKLLNTVQMLCKSNFQKEEFMKKYIPVQEAIIKKLQSCGNLSIAVFEKFSTILREEKEADAHYIEAKQKFMLNKTEQFKLDNKKLPNQNFTESQWNRNMLRVLQGLSNTHSSQLNTFKNYYKLLDLSHSQLLKQQNKYKTDLKNTMKELNTLFTEIDNNQKQQNKIIARVTKDSKSKEQKTSIFYLSELKRTEIYFRREIEAFVKRSKAILEFMKNLVRWEKTACSKVKSVIEGLLAKKKEVFKESSEGEKLVGLLAVLEDNIQESRELYFEKSLADAQLISTISTLVASEKSKVHHLIKFLSLDSNFLIEHSSPQISFKTLTSSMSFKSFEGVSLAQGWIMTSYTPAEAFLTFDHILALFDKDGNLLQSISSQSTKINKICQKNILYLQQKTKGFFRDKKQEYQLKFEQTDRMQEFILFIENQIN